MVEWMVRMFCLMVPRVILAVEDSCFSESVRGGLGENIVERVLWFLSEL